MQHKDNNLNLLRLVAALMVLYAHSFAFYGNVPAGFLGLASYGGLGIEIFFIISGFLIVKSWDFDPSWRDFLIKRGLRIFPALTVVVLISMFILGPIFTTLTIKGYFSHHQFMGYLNNIILFPVFYLPGVLETARIPNAVNGSLWSLPVEFAMYLVVMMLGLVFKASKFVYAGVTCLFAAVVIFWCWRDAPLVVYYGTDVRNIFLTGIYFMLGACYAKFGVERWFSLSGICILVLATIMLAPYPGVSKILLWVTLPYVVLAFGLSRSWLGTYFNRLGDCSYGVYIYAFPVQQFVLQTFPSISYQAYLLNTVIITLILGYISWHVVEKRILKFKPKRIPLAAESKKDVDSLGLTEKA